MDRATQRALNALNREFYAREAQAWTESRKQPWPGFARALASARAHWRASPASDAQSAGLVQTRPRILDVGSGDGRFAAFLCEALGGELDYHGVDSSRELTAHARARALGPQLRFELADFVETPPSAALPAGPFELISLLGVLHHVPGHDARIELLRALAQRIDAGGSLALTFWRLPDDARFASRVIPWSAYNARAAQPIDEAQLEPGDTLLRFGPAHAERYCHFPDPTETEALIACTNLSVRARFRADGRADQLNEYVVLGAV